MLSNEKIEEIQIYFANKKNNISIIKEVNKQLKIIKNTSINNEDLQSLISKIWYIKNENKILFHFWGKDKMIPNVFKALEIIIIEKTNLTDKKEINNLILNSIKETNDMFIDFSIDDYYNFLYQINENNKKELTKEEIENIEYIAKLREYLISTLGNYLNHPAFKKESQYLKNRSLYYEKELVLKQTSDQFVEQMPFEFNFEKEKTFWNSFLKEIKKEIKENSSNLFEKTTTFKDLIDKNGEIINIELFEKTLKDEFNISSDMFKKHPIVFPNISFDFKERKFITKNIVFRKKDDNNDDPKYMLLGKIEPLIYYPKNNEVIPKKYKLGIILEGTPDFSYLKKLLLENKITINIEDISIMSHHSVAAIKPYNLIKFSEKNEKIICIGDNDTPGKQYEQEMIDIIVQNDIKENKKQTIEVFSSKDINLYKKQNDDFNSRGVEDESNVVKNIKEILNNNKIVQRNNIELKSYPKEKNIFLSEKNDNKKYTINKMKQLLKENGLENTIFLNKLLYKKEEQDVVFGIEIENKEDVLAYYLGTKNIHQILNNSSIDNQEHLKLFKDFEKTIFIEKLIPPILSKIETIDKEYQTIQKKENKTKEEYSQVNHLYLQKMLLWKEWKILKEIKELPDPEIKNKIEMLLSIAKIVADSCKELNEFVNVRGSANNMWSLYNLGITNLDPLKYPELLTIEGFLTVNKFPDVDFEINKEAREKILEHINKKYGTLTKGLVETKNGLCNEHPVKYNFNMPDNIKEISSPTIVPISYKDLDHDGINNVDILNQNFQKIIEANTNFEHTLKELKKQKKDLSYFEQYKKQTNIVNLLFKDNIHMTNGAKKIMAKIYDLEYLSKPHTQYVIDTQEYFEETIDKEIKTNNNEILNVLLLKKRQNPNDIKVYIKNLNNNSINKYEFNLSTPENINLIKEDLIQNIDIFLKENYKDKKFVDSFPEGSIENTYLTFKEKASLVKNINLSITDIANVVALNRPLFHKPMYFATNKKGKVEKLVITNPSFDTEKIISKINGEEFIIDQDELDEELEEILEIEKTIDNEEIEEDNIEVEEEFNTNNEESKIIYVEPIDDKWGLFINTTNIPYFGKDGEKYIVPILAKSYGGDGNNINILDKELSFEVEKENQYLIKEFSKYRKKYQANELLMPYLKQTFGMIIYQEQLLLFLQEFQGILNDEEINLILKKITKPKKITKEELDKAFSLENKILNEKIIFPKRKNETDERYKIRIELNNDIIKNQLPIMFKGNAVFLKAAHVLNIAETIMDKLYKETVINLTKYNSQKNDPASNNVKNGFKKN
jgi:hypothetical protein